MIRLRSNGVRASLGVAGVAIVVIAPGVSGQLGQKTGARPGTGQIIRRPVAEIPFRRPPMLIAGLPAAVTRDQANAIVSTREQLVAALAAGHKIIWVEDRAEIDLASVADHRESASAFVIQIPEGVTLAGGRSESVEGGLLYFSRPLPQSHMIAMGNRTRLTGLRIRGPHHGYKKQTNLAEGIAISGVADVLIDRCEISDWSVAGVGVSGAPNTKSTAARIRVTYNYIHHNQMDGLGYGVVVGGSQGFVLIDRNTFDFNRHHVAGDGSEKTGYIAEFNFALGGQSYYDNHYEHHFDMHGTGGGATHHGGTGGEFVDVRQNAILGAQTYGFLGRQTRPAFVLRGQPTDSAHFRNNVLAHDDPGKAIREEGGDYERFFVTANRFDTDPSTELAAGDFDGDGAADVFVATGVFWAFSPRGEREWRFLNAMPQLLKVLAFGDFDGNGKTDVFLLAPGGWRVSRDGVGPFLPLPASYPVDPKQLRLGDFDGDRKTDVFFSDARGQWKFSSGGSTAFQDLNSSSLKIDELRFADFDGDQKTDVFSFSNKQWSVSYGGRSGWERLNAQISAKLGELVFADFNGDRKCDIGRSNGQVWEVSWGGATPWQRLNPGSFLLYPLSSMVAADFDGDRRADILHLERGVGMVRPGLRYGASFLMAKDGSAPLARRSANGMR